MFCYNESAVTACLAEFSTTVSIFPIIAWNGPSHELIKERYSKSGIAVTGTPSVLIPAIHLDPLTLAGVILRLVQMGL